MTLTVSGTSYSLRVCKFVRCVWVLSKSSREDRESLVNYPKVGLINENYILKTVVLVTERTNLDKMPLNFGSSVFSAYELMAQHHLNQVAGGG